MLMKCSSTFFSKAMSVTSFDPSLVETPAYVVDLALLKRNVELLKDIQVQSGAKILLALKGFAMFSTFPLIRDYLEGCCASGLNEALLAYHEFQKEVHVYCPAYKEAEMEQIFPIAGHVSFNSVAQWKKFKHWFAKEGAPSPGLRVNPEHSEVEVALYDPCSPGCRLGTRDVEIQDGDLEGLEGLHFHALCEQNSDTLERVVKAVEARFPKFLQQVKWVNMGGGHHITKPGYDLERLIRVIREFKAKHNVQVYLEPGEAIGLNTGYLVTQVLDIVGVEGSQTAILDVSATCHMPDVLEMPYRPVIIGAGMPGEYAYTYKLGGTSCLAGDVIGEYSFPEPLQEGQRLVFTDMAHYTMVKTTTFNGVPHPSIATYDPVTKEYKVVRKFGYEDFRNRLS